MRVNAMLKIINKSTVSSIKKMALLLSLPLILLSGQSLASGTINISFVDNQRIPITLSDTNINRIVVSNDQITNVLCPSSYCTSTHNPDDASGAVYIKLLTTQPFTLFLSTNAGHQLSFQVTPKASNGKTFVLNPSGASPQAQKWEKESSYRKVLVKLIKDMMDGKTPSGYGYTAINDSRSLKVFHGLGTLKIKAIWTGDYLMGTEYEFKNNANKIITIPDSAFYQSGVRLVAQSSQSVLPGNTENVYEITSREQ